MERFPNLIKTNEEAIRYYQNRSIQFLQFGWAWPGDYKEYSWGIETRLISPEQEEFFSIYVVEKGQNHLKKWLKDNPTKKFITSNECIKMKNYLTLNGIEFKLLETNFSAAYYLIESFYGNKQSRRSKQFYMNHIDEGLYILNKLGADSNTKDAWCLHPIFQDDCALINSLTLNYKNINSESIIYAMEYRNVANNHLPKHKSKSPKLSILPEVNLMLIADKIQNCKDFEFYLLEREDVDIKRLSEYFHTEWFPVLNISDDFYFNCLKEINNMTGKNSKSITTTEENNNNE